MRSEVMRMDTFKKLLSKPHSDQPSVANGFCLLKARMWHGAALGCPFPVGFGDKDAAGAEGSGAPEPCPG